MTCPSCATGSHFFEPDPHAKCMGEILQFLKNWFLDPRILNFAAMTAKFSELLVNLFLHNSYYAIWVIGGLQHPQNSASFIIFAHLAVPFSGSSISSITMIIEKESFSKVQTTLSETYRFLVVIMLKLWSCIISSKLLISRVHSLALTSVILELESLNFTNLYFRRL